MPDREKVIKGLECCIESDKTASCEEECPYYITCWGGESELGTKLKEDALALLNEQEKPKRESEAMLPCKCGGKLRAHWYSQEKGEGLKCERCGFVVWGKNATDVIRKWNEAVKCDD